MIKVIYDPIDSSEFEQGQDIDVVVAMPFYDLIGITMDDLNNIMDEKILTDGCLVDIKYQVVGAEVAQSDEDAGEVLIRVRAKYEEI